MLGIISARLGDSYKVDLGSSSPATLPLTGFEGTTKKNRPNLAIGDVVFARVSVANKDLEPELVCLDGENRPDGFGEIKDGMLWRCSCDLARRYPFGSFIDPDHGGIVCSGWTIESWRSWENIAPLKSR